MLWWLEQPFAFALWTYYHLQELDRRRQWSERMYRLDAASLGAIAVHDPERLSVERKAALADAAPAACLSDAEILARAHRMIADIHSGQVLVS